MTGLAEIDDQQRSGICFPKPGDALRASQSGETLHLKNGDEWSMFQHVLYNYSNYNKF